ncbi:MAG: FAD-binding oxidoreductase [Pseudobdellovibrionaceae bacterium]
MSLDTFLQADQIKTDSESLQYYGKDWTTYFDIKAKAIVFPRSTEDVVHLVQWARKNKIALIPSGGRTGLSGAAVATQGEVVVSFEQMNKILDFDPINQTVRVQAGVVTEDLQKFAQEKGLLYPVDFAARGSSQMGGNIATNAGGIKVVRYGLTRQWVAGLQVVTGQGELLNLNNGLVKNATGYDLRHLIIGSEGTLGLVTEALIQLSPPAPEVKVLLLAVNDLSSIMNIFSEFKKKTSVVAFEMFSALALKHVLHGTGLPAPLETSSEYYVVCEVECKNESDEGQILSVFESGLEQGFILDGVLSQSETQAKTLWRYREDISESLASYSPYKNDIAVTISKVPDFLNDLQKVLTAAYPTWEVVWFGHIGDGNLHINILRPTGMSKEQFVKDCRAVDELVFSAVRKYQGSISAEHGVGLTKKSFLTYTRSEPEVELMRQIKKVFDPDQILNPGKIF